MTTKFLPSAASEIVMSTSILKQIRQNCNIYVSLSRLMAYIIMYEMSDEITYSFSNFNGAVAVRRSFDAFFDLRLHKRLSQQSRCRWFEISPRSLWRHCNCNAGKVIHRDIWKKTGAEPQWSVKRELCDLSYCQCTVTCVHVQNDILFWLQILDGI